MREEFRIKNTLGEVLVGEIESDSKSDKIVVVVHGYATSRTYGTSKLTRALHELHLSTASFDLSGNGESEGSHATKTITQWADDIQTLVDFLQGKGFKHISLVTASMGNMHGLIVAAGGCFERIFCWAPSLNFVERNEILQGKNWDADWKKKGLKVKHTNKGYDVISNYSLVEDARSYDFRKYFPKISAETLFCYGDQDDHVAPKLIQEAVELMPDASAICFEGVNHYTNDENLPVIKEALLDWFRDW